MLSRICFMQYFSFRIQRLQPERKCLVGAKFDCGKKRGTELDVSSSLTNWVPGRVIPLTGGLCT